MLKKTVDYKDFDGVEQSEELYFNLTKSEIIQMEASEDGGMEKFLVRIFQEKDTRKLITFFKQFILMSYGKKSLDGKKFVKNDELRAEFESSAAFDALFMELFSSEQKMADFVNAVMPPVSDEQKEEARKKLAELQAK